MPSGPARTRRPLSVWGRRLISFATGVALALTGVVALGAPAHAATGPFAYVANIGGNTVSVIDTSTNAVTAGATVGSSPANVVLSPTGTQAYVTNLGSNTVSVFDTATNAVTATVPVGSGPLTVALTPSGALAYVTNNGTDTVSVLDTATNTVSATVTVGTAPNGVSFNAAGTRAYVADYGSGTVSVIDTATSTVTATIPVGNNPAQARINPSGTAVYATNQSDNTVSVIDTASHTVTTTITGLTGPYGMAFEPAPQTADIAVALAAQPHLGILVPSLGYTLTARNAGPGALTSATLSATPAGASATNLAAGCTSVTTTVTCTYGPIAAGASVSKTFRVPLSLLTLGPVTVTGVRTASAPVDPNPANDTAAVTCTALSVVLVSCP
ncbi:YncE family protein [Streptomyces sp. NPDC046385]|uniref:YncE family protein n=1 Tax=Streptomyces sp. NPDC046385 TaxID=3154918 RepID=UPI003406FECC